MALTINQIAQGLGARLTSLVPASVAVIGLSVIIRA
jgi:hypothetical protein